MRWKSQPQRAPRDEAGQTMLLIVGFVVVLMTAIAVVVNVSSAYLDRQSLDSLADGAALAAADGGAQGNDVYSGGLDAERLELFERTARGAVDDYLAATGAAADFPGLRRSVEVDVSSQSVRVRVSAPVGLPFGVPGIASEATISATGAAAVSPEP